MAGLVASVLGFGMSFVGCKVTRKSALVLFFGTLAFGVHVQFAEASSRDGAVLAPPARDLSKLLGQGNEHATLTGAGQSVAKRTVRSARNTPLPRRRPAHVEARWAEIQKIAAIERQFSTTPFHAGGAEWKCLTEALYFEARGESVRGQVAVAEVILNRRDSSRYPDTICEVVQQGAPRRHKCQFSYNCDGLTETFDSAADYERVGRVAQFMLGGFRSNLTDGALFYHNVNVNPDWKRKLNRTATIGSHYFYSLGGS